LVLSVTSSNSLANYIPNRRALCPEEKEELQTESTGLESENEILQDQVDSIADIIEPEEDEDDEGED
jgi:hypothetical protein